MVIKVTGCSDCPFYDCGSCRAGWDDVIDEDDEENPITPDWCPLTKDHIIVQGETNGEQWT